MSTLSQAADVATSVLSAGLIVYGVALWRKAGGGYGRFASVLVALYGILSLFSLKFGGHDQPAGNWWVVYTAATAWVALWCSYKERRR